MAWRQVAFHLSIDSQVEADLVGHDYTVGYTTYTVYSGKLRLSNCSTCLSDCSLLVDRSSLISNRKHMIVL